MKEFEVDANKVDVVYNGVDKIFKPIGQLEREAIKAHYAVGWDYFVFVGALHPRKNIGRLLQAYDAFRKRSGEKVKLVLVGKKMWWTKELELAFEGMNYKEDVIFTGRLETEALAKVVAASLALVYVSYFEGFGVPILEGFAAGTAVITSSVTSMPEVAGGAALLVDPYDVDEITAGLIKLATDKAYRDTLIATGLKRQAAFSWERTSNLLLDSIMRVVG